MRYAFISDIHSNIQALNAVLDDINNQNIECLICLGDIVGYGASPVEVIEKLKNITSEFVLGNHDAAVAGYIQTSNFNENAKISLEWTRERLSKEHKKFLGRQPLEVRFESMRFAHASFDNSAVFPYLIEPDDAAASFDACTEQLLFTGHTHIPGIYVISSRKVPHWLPPIDFGIESDKRYIINVGSVGLPRDNDPRASYCIYDSEKGDIFFRKVKFDVFKYKELLIENNLPSNFEFFNYALKKKPPQECHDFQQPMSHESFSPLGEKETQRLYAKIQDLDNQVNSMRKIQNTFLMLIFSLMVIFSIAGLIVFIFPKFIKNTQVIKISGRYNELPHFKLSKAGNLLPSPKVLGEVSQKNPLDYYSFNFYDKSQKIKIIKTKDSKHKMVSTFSLFSDNADKPVIICSGVFQAKKQSRFKIGTQLKLINTGNADCRLALEYYGEDKKWHSILEKYISNFKNKKRWITTSSTMPKNKILKSAVTLRYVIELNFKGNILIRKSTILKK
jgi:predicted phosphodiesterase